MTDRRPGTGLQSRTQRLPNVGKHSPDRYEDRVSRAEEDSLATLAKRKRIEATLAELETKARAIVFEMKIDTNIASNQTKREIGSGIEKLARARSKILATL